MYMGGVNAWKAAFISMDSVDINCACMEGMLMNLLLRWQDYTTPDFQDMIDEEDIEIETDTHSFIKHSAATI